MKSNFNKCYNSYGPGSNASHTLDKEVGARWGWQAFQLETLKYLKDRQTLRLSEDCIESQGLAKEIGLIINKIEKL